MATTTAPSSSSSTPAPHPQPDAPPATNTITVGVLLFEGYEPLDLVGPVSVFGSVEEVGLCQVVFRYIARAAGPVTSKTGAMTLVASHSFADLPPQKGSLDWLLVPGGVGTRAGVTDEALLSYIRGWCDPAVGLGLVMSVCTGSALLAAAGVLDGRRATSNKVAWGWVTSLPGSAAVSWVRKARWVQDGPFLTSSGVTAGTDAAVAAVKALLSPGAAAAAAKRLEHVPVTDAGEDPYADETYLPAV